LTYDRLVAELFPRLSGGIRWGLDRTRRLLAGVGDPQRAYPALHIGGTNGKGSAAALLASALRADGRRVGLYSSPHLCDFRERFRVDGEPLDAAAVLAAAERLWPAIERERPSFFEATTALAFLALAEAGVDLAVVEVGLGGRLDATNVVEPLVTAITNVERDHMQYLGDTLAAIAAEKAGIFKPAVPAVTAEQGAEALAVLRARAAEIGAPLVALEAGEIQDIGVASEGTSFALDSCWGRLAVRTPLVGAHQAWNAAVALRTLEALPDGLRPARAAVLAGLASVSWPGRLQQERIGAVDWLFDVAHNVAGMRALVAALTALAPRRPLVAVVGVLGDKDWRGMLAPLAACADELILTVPRSAPSERIWDPEAVLGTLPRTRAVVRADLDDALATAQRDAATVLVTGSFHTVGDALRALGRQP
jgi:dihydrofolate synthase / folylpolyglutamate synthase